ncbi:MAG: saccharopine dehydrogenase NADP-binding domain-containing protein [Melioribacter sp.]|nr:saccharopine dehydrogenase NADP-binding domain-containing protein [Melioribacter sp.]
MASFTNRLMVYGANGYSAQLIIEELIARGIKPVLAGRNLESIRSVAEKYLCDYRVFDLNYDNESKNSLQDIHTIINCAGPFKYTAKDMIDYCLTTKTNYIDITGEIPAFAYAFGCNNRAKESEIVILPGAGFDVIPTDCLAKRLSEQMPDALNLKLGFANRKGGISRGTTLTSLEFISGKGKVRRNGKVIDSPLGEFNIKVLRKKFSLYGISIPWGDVFTAYISTGIPNIEVYMGVHKFLFVFKRILFLLLHLFNIPVIKKLSTNYVSKNFTGPDKEMRDSTETYIWGKVENEKGESIEQIYRVMEGYNLTAKGAAESALRIMRNELKPGTYTPSLAFGSDFLNIFTTERVL